METIPPSPSPRPAFRTLPAEPAIRPFRNATPPLSSIIAHAVNAARAQGLDERRQYDRAIRAVLRSEPGLTLPTAARLVNRHLEVQDPTGLMLGHP